MLRAEKAGLISRRYEISDDGRGVARFQRKGRGGRITADGIEYRFEKSSLMSWDVVLMSGDQRVGGVTRTSAWRGSATAELPGLDPARQVFAFCAVVAAWDVRMAVAAS